jgi:hypothetical protein
MSCGRCLSASTQSRESSAYHPAVDPVLPDDENGREAITMIAGIVDFLLVVAP